MSTAPETYNVRLRKYQRRERMSIWVGAGYAGLIALMTTKIFEQANAPYWLTAALVTLVVLGGGALGRARVGFEWVATQIERDIEDQVIQKGDTLPNGYQWPAQAELFWTVTLVFIFIAAIAMLATVWWPVLKALFCRLSG